MIKVVVFDSRTGRILRNMQLGDEKEVSQNISDGEGWLFGFADPKTDRVVAGEVVPRDPSDLEEEAREKRRKEFRAERNRRLSETDWTQVLDAPVDRAAWAEYRQSLRDLPETAEDLADVVWPTPPA